MASLYVRTDLFDHALLPQYSSVVSHTVIKSIIAFLSPFTNLDYKISPKQIHEALLKYIPILTQNDCMFFTSQYYKLVSEEIDPVVTQSNINDKNIDIRCFSLYLYLQTYIKKAEANNMKKQFNDIWPVCSSLV